MKAVTLALIIQEVAVVKLWGGIVIKFLSLLSLVSFSSCLLCLRWVSGFEPIYDNISLIASSIPPYYDSVDLIPYFLEAPPLSPFFEIRILSEVLFLHSLNLGLPTPDL